MTASFVDAIYFSMVTLTTVGYGDMGPSTPGTRLFTCFFAMFGVGVAGLSLGVFIDEIRKFRARTQAARHQIDYAYTLRTPTVQCSAYEAFVCRIGMYIICAIAILYGAVITSQGASRSSGCPPARIRSISTQRYRTLHGHENGSCSSFLWRNERTDRDVHMTTGCDQAQC